MIDSQTLLSQLNWRYATKKFDASKKIDAKTWAALEETLILSPSSYGLQPWKFVIVQDQSIREKLLPLSWNQKQVTDCSHFVVFLAKTEMTEEYITRYIDRICEIRHTTPDTLEGYKRGMLGDVVNGPRGKITPIWATHQLYIALGNLMTAAAMIGVDACPMEGIEPEKYDDVLGLKGSGFVTRVACALGYRHAEDIFAKAKKVRFPASEMIVHK